MKSWEIVLRSWMYHPLIHPFITIGHDCQFKRVLPSLWLQSCHLFSSELADGCDPALCMPCHSGYYSFYKVLRCLEAIRVIVIVTIKATPHRKLVKEWSSVRIYQIRIKRCSGRYIVLLPVLTVTECSASSLLNQITVMLAGIEMVPGSNEVKPESENRI